MEDDKEQDEREGGLGVYYYVITRRFFSVLWLLPFLGYLG